MEKLLRTLNQINWDFSDYNSMKFPLDINSIPWYPATFPPLIPKFLIALLSKEGDIVFDLFGGKGTTIIEAIKQNRRFYYNDLNPFAADIVSNVINIIKGYYTANEYILNIPEIDAEALKKAEIRLIEEDSYEGKNRETIYKYSSHQLIEDIKVADLSEELIYWYHADTLRELIYIYKLIGNSHNDCEYHIRKFAFVSILKEVCSQRGHFTYITDNCRPSKIIYYDAVKAYLSMLERIRCSVIEFLKQYQTINRESDLLDIISNSYINCGDSRKLNWLESQSIDFVITSPPYLCAQDYVRTMRLINFFFPDKNFKDLSQQEIGARCKRKGKANEIVLRFYDDMDKVLAEINRVLKKDKFFSLIIGQGKGKVTKDYDTVKDISALAIKKYGFEKIFQTTRMISYKSVRVGGVDSEEILVFRKIK